MIPKAQVTADLVVPEYKTDVQLYDGGWFSHSKTSEGVEFLQEKKDGVTVLCFDRGRNKFLLLHERVSATKDLRPSLCALTGSIDEGEQDIPDQTALRELSEEAGIVLLAENLHFLSRIYTFKACTKRTYVYFADITDAAFIRPTGDGSEVEEQAFVAWHNLDQLLAAEDGLLLASWGLAVAKGLLSTTDGSVPTGT